jgi:hypothetical protein
MKKASTNLFVVESLPYIGLQRFFLDHTMKVQASQKYSQLDRPFQRSHANLKENTTCARDE